MNIIKKCLIFPVFLFSLIYFKPLFEIFYLDAIPMHDTLWSYFFNFFYRIIFILKLQKNI